MGIDGRGKICALKRELSSEGIQIILCLRECSGVKVVVVLWLVVDDHDARGACVAGIRRAS
jgi:hypothetical protein